MDNMSVHIPYLVTSIFLIPTIVQTNDQTNAYREWNKQFETRIQADQYYGKVIREAFKIKSNQDLTRLMKFPTAPLKLEQLKPGVKGHLESIPFAIVQVIPQESKVLLRHYDKKRYFMLSNYTSNEITNNQFGLIFGYVEIGPAVTYETVLGTNTALTIRLLSKKEAGTLDDEIDKQVKLELAADLRAEYPEWKFTDGTTLQAKFVRYSGGSVELITIDQKTVRRKIVDFHEVDRDSIRKLIQDQRKKKSRS